jgi:hypothetical protein
MSGETAHDPFKLAAIQAAQAYWRRKKHDRASTSATCMESALATFLRTIAPACDAMASDLCVTLADRLEPPGSTS